MKQDGHDEIRLRDSEPQFATTRWSLVLAVSGDDTEEARGALAELCQAYWYPVYAYVRRRISKADEAQDLTQEFFARLLEKHTIETADPSRGQFRAFLLTACKRFLVNEWHRERAAKRGGGRAPLSLNFEWGESRFAAEAVDTMTPERFYERQWALALLNQVLEKLKEEAHQKDKLRQFEQLKAFLAGSEGAEAYRAAADSLGMSEGAAKVAVHRLRKRYGEILRREIAQTVVDPQDVDAEICRLFEVL